MLKLILSLAAAIPIFPFLRATVFRRSTAIRLAFADLKRQVTLSWLLLFFVGCAIVYSLGTLITSFWN